MRIEIGESLFFSWLRHVKGCQIVQTNWKMSPQWRELQNRAAIEQLLTVSREFFQRQYGWEIYKSSSLDQLLVQGEIDLLGGCFIGDAAKIYAVEVAFHEKGLKYGNSTPEICAQVVKKLLRAAMGLAGYLGVRTGEIIFASPKIHPAVIGKLTPCVAEVDRLLQAGGFSFTARLLANQDFAEQVIEPVLLAGKEVADTTDFFLRSYQLLKMFKSKIPPRRPRANKPPASKSLPSSAPAMSGG
ncbi:hypothetical protein FACS1894139_10470 [Planctomycetales bacterium]|nr:hypothetical protein FACS1894107_04310 [Planctomycetales bacterium]GHS98482.1 hypothetical protein FACS1894108_06720 [Planctomycetales bacterium]GHT05867.1 hypothetical protein FACS1894139_10470 [Planctomycetales bacterium]